MILRVWVTEIRSSISKHSPRALRVAFDRRTRNTLEVILTQRNKGIRDKTRLRRVGIIVGVIIGHAAEIVEGLEVVVGYALSFRIHAAKLPFRKRVAIC